MKMTQTTFCNIATFALVEISPILLFFIGFRLYGFDTAVIALAEATAIATIFSIIIKKRIPYFALIVSGSTILAAVATITTDNPHILIIRDSFYYSGFGVILLLLASQKTLILKKMFDQIFGITDTAWLILQRRWGILLIIIGAINTLIGFSLPLSLWVTYKAGIIIVFILFGLYQFTLTRNHRLTKTNNLGLWSEQ